MTSQSPHSIRDCEWGDGVAEFSAVLNEQPSEPDSGGRRLGVPVRRRRLPWTALVVLAVIVLGSLFAPWLAPYDPLQISPVRFAAAGYPHLLGTDELGRDLLSRIMYGGRVTLVISIGAALVAGILGTLWGMAAAFGRGLIDEILMRIADISMAIPQMLFALVFVAGFGASPIKLALIIGVLLTPVTARIVRSAVLVERESDYYAAAIAYGASRWRLIGAEVLPNVLVPIGVQAAINVANAIVLEAALSFVGLGLKDPDTSWGILVKLGYEKMNRSLGYVLFPALFIFLTIWMLNVIADSWSRIDERRH